MSYNFPDRRGYFGKFGGRFVPETLIPALDELESGYQKIRRDPAFRKEFQRLLHDFAGRPTPLYFAARMTKDLGRARIFIKREDLAHTGAHKINNALGQALLARRLGKTRIIAETGAGQHGVAAATAAAFLGLACEVYMGEEDIRRQHLNVIRMERLGARVIPVSSGSKTLKDAINEAIRDWVSNVDHTHYLLGSVVGPHPYPMIVRDFQSVIGAEVKKEFSSRGNRFPDYLIACVGGGSNAAGIFYPFIDYPRVKKIGVEAAGIKGISGASLCQGRPGVLHGAYTYLLQDDDGQIKEAHSIAPGLDYPGVGPELSYWKEAGLVEYHQIADREAVTGFKYLAQMEGIIPALEPSHAVAFLLKFIKKTRKSESVVLNLSGRGDKDLGIVEETKGHR